MTEIAVSLTAAEVDLLGECEVVIERGMGVFIEVGSALMLVRDNKLYRAEFSTFEDYCLQRWELTDRHANHLIASARVLDELISGTIVPEIIPATESQARELAPLLDDPDELRDVWQHAVERTEGRPTAAAVRAIRMEREPQVASAVWSQDESLMRACAEAGETVVASFREHANLIAWAESEGLFVRIDRRSDWGNPFEMPQDGNRETVIENYRDHYLPHKPSLIERVGELRGKVLGCWCAPAPCHGDALKARTIA